MMASKQREMTTEAIAASAAKHGRRSDWSRADRRAYLAAAKRGLLDTVCAHMKPVPPKRVRSDQEIRASAAAFPSRAAWERGDPSAYYAARRRGLMDAVCQHMPRSPRKLPLEALMASAALYKNRNAWKKADPSAYVCACQRGLLEVVCAHMTRKRVPSEYWTLERCKESAAAYCSREAWSNGARSAYYQARKNGWLDQCCAHMAKYQRPSKWTPQRIEASAKRFSTKKAWHQGEGAAYSAAKRLGIFEQVTAHMVGPRVKRDKT